MSGPYDEIDVNGMRYEAHKSLDEASEFIDGILEAMKWINRSQGKTYRLEFVKQAQKHIQKAKENLKR